MIDGISVVMASNFMKSCSKIGATKKIIHSFVTIHRKLSFTI